MLGQLGSKSALDLKPARRSSQLQVEPLMSDQPTFEFDPPNSAPAVYAVFQCITQASKIMPTKSKSSTASARKSRRPTEPPPVVAPATEPANGTASSFKIGDRVTHHMFGGGIVEAVRDNKLRIKFETVGSKEILASFITRPR
jgi:hypothetical protein